MAEPSTPPVDSWLSLLLGLGYEPLGLLAAGSEGRVYRLGSGHVAKVWYRRTAEDVRRAQAFYNDLRAARLPFSTPMITDVHEAETNAVSIEVELSGESMQRHLPFGAKRLDSASTQAFVKVLASLALVSPTPAMRDMRVLGEAKPFRVPGDSFPTALSQLIDRRVNLHPERWRRRLSDFDVIRAAVHRALRELNPGPESVLHGDLFGENVLMTPEGHVAAVLDFGFVSTAGDSRFDAAVCAAIVNLYGPHAEDVRRTSTVSFARELGYDIEVLHLYQAAYALVTSDYFSEDGKDGHTEWCVGLLHDPDVRAALDTG